jgi:redox-sensitive bicupin YhaK (pirin superfamily)
MITIRRAAERGHADHGWLDTFHTFSFADYVDPDWMEFRALRVLNDDRIEPGRGFGMHPHRDMEIVTIVFEGALQHRDSMGNTEMIRAGEVQRMTAGTGVVHSEFNPSEKEGVHLYQIWILPEKTGLAPGYEQKAFPAGRGLRLVASRDGRDSSLTIHQDASVYRAGLGEGESLAHEVPSRRHAWVQVARGAVTLNGRRLEAGDGAAVSGKETLELKGVEPADLILFDLA